VVDVVVEAVDVVGGGFIDVLVESGKVVGGGGTVVIGAPVVLGGLVVGRAHELGSSTTSPVGHT
jgi:hypothetical protein